MRERERERERDERMRENREREWEIERERATLLAGQNNNSGRPALRGELFNLLPKMTNEDPVAFFLFFFCI